MKTCNVTECNNKHEARGYCNKHYLRVRANNTLVPKHIRGNDTARFWSYVDKSGDCWLWTGNVVGGGYGQISITVNKKEHTMMAHRYSFKLKSGKYPAKGMHLDHLCRNRRCVNPDHLEVVTPSENTRRGLLHTNRLDPLPVGIYKYVKKGGDITYRVVKRFEGKGVHLGTFRTVDEANIVHETAVMVGM